MQRRIHTWFATLLWLALLAPITTYAQAPAGPHRPAAVPADFVITPFGYFHPSCVVHLAEGDTLVGNGLVVQHRDRTLTNIPACEYPHYTAQGEVIAAGKKLDAPTISHSWIVSGGVTTTSSYGELVADWTVPSSPLAYNGQTVYLFPGLEDSNDVVSIIQPVLGWNADYSQAWGIASWNCCPSGTTDESSPVKVNAGDLIVGTMKSTCSAGTLSCSKWNITTQDASLNKSTTLSNTPNEGQTFNWAFGGALEVYSVAQCSDYPPNDYVTFYPALYNDSFGIIANPAWSITDWASGLTPQCDYGGQVSSGQVTLDFGNAGGPPWSFSTGIPPNNQCSHPGTYSFTLNQLYNANSLQWSANVATNETETISLSYTLSDSKGTLTSGDYNNGQSGTENFSVSRAPVGTPTLEINASVLQLETGCDAEFQENLTGTN